MGTWSRCNGAPKIGWLLETLKLCLYCLSNKATIAPLFPPPFWLVSWNEKISFVAICVWYPYVFASFGLFEEHHQPPEPVESCNSSNPSISKECGRETHSTTKKSSISSSLVWFRLRQRVWMKPVTIIMCQPGSAQNCHQCWQSGHTTANDSPASIRSKRALLFCYPLTTFVGFSFDSLDSHDSRESHLPCGWCAVVNVGIIRCLMVRQTCHILESKNKSPFLPFLSLSTQ